MSGCKDKHNFSIQQDFYRKYDNHKHDNHKYDNRKSKKGTALAESMDSTQEEPPPLSLRMG
jgi:hypothetical protein